MALAHYPVVNKNGRTIASAVTSLDLHDIARASKTFGIELFYVVTPLEDQKILVDRIVRHWTDGPGSHYNGLRKQALELIRIEHSLESAKRHIAGFGDGAPKVVATCARHIDNSIDYDRMKEMLATGDPYLLVFGTAWGLPDTLLKSTDYVLEPIGKNKGYNHLSVRSAAAIMLDRLVGEA
ncbi:MAG: RNA methyltransferase [Desulfobacterales bacterium]